MSSRETRIRLFLAFLILVLVLVNSQSLQLSYQSRDQLTRSFEEGARARSQIVLNRFVDPAVSSDDSLRLQRLSSLAADYGFRSICFLDWDARLVAGFGNCETTRPPGVAGSPAADRFDKLGRGGRRLLVEERWVMSPLNDRYDDEVAQAYGYLNLDTERGAVVLAFDTAEATAARARANILRVGVPAPELALANRRLRQTLYYQIAALALVLLTLVLFLNSLLAPQRRLVAEARSVADASGEADTSGDENQFVLATFQDVVGKLREKEKELARLHRLEKARADETEALATDIIRSMTTALVSLDPSGRIALMNPAAERIFSLSSEAKRGQPFSETFTGSEELAAMVHDALGPGSVALREHLRYETRESPRGVIHLGVSVLPISTGTGERRGALCLMADLTEVIELRERLFLKDNLARLGEMAAGIAHEFRNGLATILGNARLVRPSLQGESQAVVDALIEEGRALSRVVSEFLQFARPEPMRVERFALDALIKDVLAELSPQAEELSVQLVDESERLDVLADEMLLRKAVANLVRNAIESVGDSDGSERWVRVGCRSRDDQALILVTDSGVGLPAEGSDQMFTPFFTSKTTGTGLGLSVVQKIAISHHGAVIARNRPEGGAAFTLSLPIEAPATQPATTLADHW